MICCNVDTTQEVCLKFDGVWRVGVSVYLGLLEAVPVQEVAAHAVDAALKAASVIGN